MKRERIATMRNRLTTFLFSFNSVILVVYTLKDAGTITLSSYTQQKTSAREPGGQPITFTPTHLLMCAEIAKLVLSLVWCAIEVAQRLNASLASNNTVLKVVSADEATMVPPGDADTRSPICRSQESCSDHHVPCAARRWVRLWLRMYTREIKAQGNTTEVFLMAVPAVTYALQNFLFIYALKLLNPTVFQLLYQLRIPLTAVLMRLALRTNITRRKWLAICVLCVGVSVTQLAVSKKSNGGKGAKDAALPSLVGQSRSTTQHLSLQGSSAYLIGLLATLLACFVSSASSVFMEFVFKKRTSHCSLSTRNIHLSLFSIGWLLMANLFEALQQNTNAGYGRSSWSEYWSTYLRGFTGLVWLLVILNAAGGILVALVMKYADNIMKSFCNAVAIVAVGIGSVYIFNFHPTFSFLLGSLLVLVAILMYSS